VVASREAVWKRSTNNLILKRRSGRSVRLNARFLIRVIREIRG